MADRRQREWPSGDGWKSRALSAGRRFAVQRSPPPHLRHRRAHRRRRRPRPQNRRRRHAHLPHRRTRPHPIRRTLPHRLRRPRRPRSPHLRPVRRHSRRPRRRHRVFATSSTRMLAPTTPTVRARGVQCERAARLVDVHRASRMTMALRVATRRVHASGTRGSVHSADAPLATSARPSPPHRTRPSVAARTRVGTFSPRM